jgi:hypothetical protein
MTHLASRDQPPWRGIGTWRRLLCGLALLAVSLAPSLAHAQDLSGLVRQGWTIKHSDSAFTTLEWRGSASGDWIEAGFGKPQPSSANPGEWLKTQLPSVNFGFGKLDDCVEYSSTSEAAVTLCMLKADNGTHLVHVIAAQVAPGSVRLAVLLSGPSQESKNRFVGQREQFFSLARSAPGATAKAPENGGGGTDSPGPSHLAYLAPGRGIPAGEVEGVYHRPQWMFMLNMGSRDFGADYILFKNGDVWRDPHLPPQDIDVVKAKAADAKNWGHWKRAGNTINLCMPDSPQNRCEAAQMIPYDPAPPDQHIEGSWHSTLSYSAKTATGVATSTLTLHASGRFEREGFAGASFQNQTGVTTAAGTFANARPATAGSYRIDGYGLELDYDDGRVERDLFYWAGGPADRNGMLMLNGTQYLGGLRR